MIWSVHFGRYSLRPPARRSRVSAKGIQDNFEVCSHPTPSLIIATLRHHIAVIQTGFKCLPREPVESSLTFFVSLVGEFKDISQIDATLIPNPMVCHYAGLEQLDEEWPGHAEQVRGTLRGDDLIIR